MIPTDNKRPRHSSLISDILRQRKSDFDSDLLEYFRENNNDDELNDDELFVLKRKEEKLNALESNVREIICWIMEQKLQLQREERVLRKEQRDQQRRAPFQTPPQEVTGRRRNQRINKRTYFTDESMEVLLDSEFLSAGDIGRLCLLAGKFFFSDLRLDPNNVWKHIFEAKFNNRTGCGLSSLYQSTKFNKILNEKGYEWMFRHFLAGHSQGEDEDEDPGEPERDEHQAEITFSGHREAPPAVLNCQNTLFVTLIESADIFGFLKATHAEVIDEDEKVEEIMASTDHICSVTYSDNESTNELINCIKHPFEFFHDKMKYNNSTDFEIWWQTLKKNVKAQPKNYHPRLVELIEKHSNRDTILKFMCRVQMSTFALRSDTNECTLLAWADDFHFEKETNSTCVTMYRKIELNHTGTVLVESYVDDERAHNYSLVLTLHVGVQFEPQEERTFLIKWSSTLELGTIDFFQILDYGINWDRHAKIETRDDLDAEVEEDEDDSDEELNWEDEDDLDEELIW